MRYPETPVRPEHNVIGGIQYDDPYQWLEDDSAEEVIGWQKTQNEIARDYVEAWPHRATLREQIARFVGAQDVPVPRRHGARWFRQRVPEERDLAVLQIADAPTGPWRTVIDLNEITTGTPLSMVGFPSRDGSLLAYTVAEAGRELTHLKVIEVDTGAVLLDGVPQERPGGVVWWPDGTGFFYEGRDTRFTDRYQFAVYAHRLGSEAPTAPEPVDLPHPVAWAAVSEDGRHAVAMVDHLRPRPQFLRTMDGDGTWRPFIEDAAHMYKGVLAGDAYIAITDNGAPRGRLVRIPLDRPDDPSAWTELVPGSDAVLASVTLVGDRLVLVELVDTLSRIRVLDLDGTEAGVVPLPGPGTVNSIAFGGAIMGTMDLVVPCEDAITYVFTSFTESPAAYLCPLDTLTPRVLTEPEHRLEGLLVTQRFATSKDGTRIPYEIVHRSDVDLTVPRATLIFGYGGFNIALLPGFIGAMAPFVQAGGIHVLAHLRGGGELGLPWWEGGRMHAKQNTFDDLYAVAEDLLRAGVTSPEMLACQGGSNGGLLAGVAAVQRPDLWRAVVSRVPVLDLLRISKDPVTMVACLSDYGNPADPHDAAMLVKHSPYHNISSGTAYPSVFIDVGANDPRCPAWHSRKYVARMQTATTSDRPVLLRVWEDAGHGGVDRATVTDQNTEWLAFVMRELDLAPRT